MAGIGFELKRLFDKKGLFALIRAYGYASVICAGPMILGVILLLGCKFITDFGGASAHEQELLNSMLTYVLLASLTLTSLFSMATTRAVADMFYEKQEQRIMPTFYGSLAIMLAVGVTGYGIFLFFAGITVLQQALNLLLFAILVVVWTEINYLTAIKDYRGILVTFFISLLLAFLIGILLIFVFDVDHIIGMLIGVCCGYGTMMVAYYVLLYKYFPTGRGSKFHFLRWFDKTPELSVIGFFVTLGMFGHLIIMWTSRINVQVQGLFYGAPTYDVPALCAFFSILITTVNFVTSMETRFYPCYRDYFSLYNDKGCINDIESCEQNMFRVMREELSYLCQKQVFTTIAFIILGSILLPHMGLGFTADMLGTFRMLCVGYAFYAIANTVMLLQLYFAYNRGAMFCALAFCIVSNVATWALRNFPTDYYGIGLVLGGLAFFVLAWTLLSVYANKIKYHVLCCQPVFATERRGLFTKLCDVLDARADAKENEEARRMAAAEAAASATVAEAVVRLGNE